MGVSFFLYTNHPRVIVEFHVLINLPSSNVLRLFCGSKSYTWSFD
jgi:hypothetical protein